MVKQGRKSYLVDYLESHGNILPPDYRNFKINNDYPNLCVLCSASIEHTQAHKLFQYNYPISATKIDTLTACCDDCNDHIESMISKWDEISLPTQVSTDLSSDESGIIGLADDAGSYSSKFIDVRNERIRDWAKRGIVYDIEPYYIHGGKHSRKCYFCRQGIKVSNPTKITIPVVESREFSGGDIRVCDTCNWEITQQLNPHIHNSFTSIKCPTCKHSYKVTENEWLYRREYGKDLFECPSCVHENIQISEATPDGTSSPYWKFNRDSEKARHCEASCQNCFTELIIDLTFKKSIIEAKYNDILHLRCKKCSTTKELTAYYNDKIRVIFTPMDGGKWIYLIEAFNTTKNIYETKLTSSFETYNVEDALSIAFDEIHKLINHEKSLEGELNFNNST